MIDALRPMMRLVVTNGTAKDIAGCGEVYGKTGEAEFPGGSHSWFAGTAEIWRSPRSSSGRQLGVRRPDDQSDVRIATAGLPGLSRGTAIRRRQR